jgi:uncharacterized protein (TIGR03435 family)
VAQSQLLAFEVASVKPSKAANSSNYSGCYFPSSKLGLIPKGKCVARNATLRSIIAAAYGIIVFNIDDYIIDGPGWIGSDRYDIEGKAENIFASNSELRAMLLTLLEERFKLKVHEEMKDTAGYALVLGKNVHGLEPAVGDKPGGIAAFGQPPNELEGLNSSMPDLAEYFVRQFHRPFVDKTGLMGRYDFKITLLLDDPRPISEPPPPGGPGARTVYALNDSALPAVSKALQDQLGLRLQPERLPVRRIVIDHAEKPDAN